MTVVFPHARLGLALIALAAGVACTGTSPQEPAAAPPAPAEAVVLSKTSQQLAGITVEAVKAEAVGDVLETVGTVALDDTRTARIGALVEGVVSATHANVGDRVRQGALLAGLHSHQVHDGWGDYRKAVADRRRVEQELSYASDALARTERLVADKAASTLELERTRAARAAATEQLAMAQAEVRRATESLEHLGISSNETTAAATEIIPVRTPQAGVVLERLVTTGTAVTPGTPLFVVSDTSSLWVLAEVDEAVLARVKVGAGVQVAVPGHGDADRRHHQRGDPARGGALPRGQRRRPTQAGHVRAGAARRDRAGADGPRAGGCRAGPGRAPGRVRPGGRRTLRPA
jgi:cobalt-zinc-cadmium efflux system membrane fusion protein